MKCSRCNKEMKILSKYENNEDVIHTELCISWECSKCDGVVDAYYHLISTVGPEIEQK